ncbi:MAG: hypothetical protein J6J61_08330 [Muribaculaceae bacterium]|nr:hypothetical protein [Muribaculaceae bacterium]
MEKQKRNLVKDTLPLRKPIMIDGQSVSAVTYDSDEIDGILFATAESKRKAAAGMKNTSISPAAEFDFGLHLYLGFAAIVAANPSYDFSDVERIKGRDVVEVMAIGRNFILASEKEQTESDSGEPTETTPESTTPAQPNSKKSQ